MISYYILYFFIGLLVLYMATYLSVKSNINIADNREDENVLSALAFLFWPVTLFIIIIVSIKTLATTKARKDMKNNDI